MITDLLNADMEEYNREMARAYAEMEFFQKHPRINWLYDKLMYLLWVPKTWICKWRGHILVDDGSYATPDSGGEGWVCTRCGESWWHQYY